MKKDDDKKEGLEYGVQPETECGRRWSAAGDGVWPEYGVQPETECGRRWSAAGDGVWPEYGVWRETDDKDSLFLDARENVNFVFDYPEAPDVSSLLMVSRPGRHVTLVGTGDLRFQLLGIAAFLTETANQKQIGLNELLARILGACASFEA